MKKYSKPEIKIECVHVETLLGGLSGGGPVTPGVKPSRRRDSLWEDDEDDWLDE